MARMGGSKHLKVQNAPAFWGISRKAYRFTLKPSAGPYPINESYPLGIILRDILKLCNNIREVKRILLDGKVKIDGKVRYDEHFPVGLMDIISIDTINKNYRLIPYGKYTLYPKEIDSNEINLKICKIKNKHTIKGNKIQYTLHDGRTIINNINAHVNDSLLIKVPEQEVIRHIKLDKDSIVIITKGDNAGNIGKVIDIKDGTFTLPKRVAINIDSKLLVLPIDMVMVISDNENIPIKVR